MTDDAERLASGFREIARAGIRPVVPALRTPRRGGRRPLRPHRAAGGRTGRPSSRRCCISPRSAICCARGRPDIRWRRGCRRSAAPGRRPTATRWTRSPTWSWPIARRSPDLCATRMTQTNEAARAAVLRPAFGRAAELIGDKPMALVEIGTSAGLLLVPDRYRYRYHDAVEGRDFRRRSADDRLRDPGRRMADTGRHPAADRVPDRHRPEPDPLDRRGRRDVAARLRLA